MATPTVDDAVRLLYDPSSRTMAATRSELRSQGLMEVNGQRVIDELVVLGAGDRDAALALAREALERVGGSVAAHWQPSRGLRPGRRVTRAQRVTVFYVPHPDGPA